VTITGDKNTLNLGDTVKLTITSLNNGPKSVDVKVDYKIPFGLKLLSSQGTGTYDSSTGIWNVGILPAGGNATTELILQANNAGSIVNTVVIYSDLPDLNPADNQARFNLVANAQDVEDIPDGELNGLHYTFPDDIRPPNNPPTPSDTPPTPEPPIPPLPPGPGPTPPDNPPIPPNPNPPAEPQKPLTQLGRDIAGVRQAVSSGTINIPEWNLTLDDGSEDEKSEEEWESFLIEFAGELIFYAALSLIPHEYIQQVKNAFLNSFEVLGNIARYFGYGKQVKQIAQLWKRIRSIINNPVYESLINKWSRLMDVLNPNLGEKLLENSLVKVFPNSVNEIKLLMNIISTKEFIKDPFGTMHSIINVVFDIVSKSIPSPKDLEKFLTI
jgi:hypothetical protein